MEQRKEKNSTEQSKQIVNRPSSVWPALNDESESRSISKIISSVNETLSATIRESLTKTLVPIGAKINQIESKLIEIDESTQLKYDHLEDNINMFKSMQENDSNNIISTMCNSFKIILDQSINNEQKKNKVNQLLGSNFKYDKLTKRYQPKDNQLNE